MTDPCSPDIVESLHRSLQSRWDDGTPYLLSASEVGIVLEAMRAGVAQTIALDLLAAKNAVRDEAGSRLCHHGDDGKRRCHRDAGFSTCLCEEVARAALCSQAPVSSTLCASPVETIRLPLWAAEDLLKWMPKVRDHRDAFYPIGLENLLVALVASLTSKHQPKGE